MLFLLLLRHAHANGASLFFLAVYLHLFRGLAMGHAWRVFVWCVGVLLLLLSVLTAFCEPRLHDSFAFGWVFPSMPAR